MEERKFLHTLALILGPVAITLNCTSFMEYIVALAR
jgi:hypothetical protein